MKITKRQLQKMVTKAKRIQEGAMEEVGGHEPVFHDPQMDEALNAYVDMYVWRIEDELGESRATLALLEVMKSFLVQALERGTDEAMADAGVQY